MGIVLSILKIIGIILLCVLGFLLFLLLLILFVPYRYRVHGEKSDSISAYARVTWLLHFVVVMLTYDDGINLRIKILGIPFYDKKRKELKEERRKEKERLKYEKDARKDDKKDGKKKEDTLPLKDDKTVEVIKDESDAASETDRKRESVSEAESETADNDGAANGKKRKKKKSFINMAEELTDKAEDILDKLPDMIDDGEDALADKIERLFEKIHELWDKLEYYHRLLTSDGAEWVYEHVKKHLIGILKAIRPVRTDACINIADDDPGKVAEVYEYQVFAMPVIDVIRGRRGEIDINAYQDDKYFDMTATVKGRVLLWAVAWHGALIILNKKVRYFIKRLKREEAEEKS